MPNGAFTSRELPDKQQQDRISGTGGDIGAGVRAGASTGELTPSTSNATTAHGALAAPVASAAPGPPPAPVHVDRRQRDRERDHERDRERDRERVRQRQLGVQRVGPPMRQTITSAGAAAIQRAKARGIPQPLMLPKRGVATTAATSVGSSGAGAAASPHAARRPHYAAPSGAPRVGTGGGGGAGSAASSNGASTPSSHGSSSSAGGSPLLGGLRNVGNSCYLNSTLQCLLALPPFRVWLTRHQEGCPRGGAAARCPACGLHDLVLRMRRAVRPQCSGAVNPSDVYMAVLREAKTFKQYQQEDAHECLTAILNFVDRAGRPRGWTPDGAAATPGRRASLVVPADVELPPSMCSLFRFALCNRVTCHNCRRHSDTLEPMEHLSIDVNATVSSILVALQRLFRPERLHGENRYFCEHCASKHDATKAALFGRLPAILALHLKRFSFDRYGGATKLLHEVKYPAVLTVPTAAVAGGGDGGAAAGGPGSGGSAVLYDLIAVLVHSGWSPRGGHYYAFVRNSRRSSIWWRKDDSDTSRVSAEVALGQRAYMLFYVRRQSVASVSSPQVQNTVVGPAPLASPAPLARGASGDAGGAGTAAPTQPTTKPANRVDNGHGGTGSGAERSQERDNVVGNVTSSASSRSASSPSAGLAQASAQVAGKPATGGWHPVTSRSSALKSMASAAARPKQTPQFKPRVVAMQRVRDGGAAPTLASQAGVTTAATAAARAAPSPLLGGRDSGEAQRPGSGGETAAGPASHDVEKPVLAAVHGDRHSNGHRNGHSNGHGNGHGIVRGSERGNEHGNEHGNGHAGRLAPDVRVVGAAADSGTNGDTSVDRRSPELAGRSADPAVSSQPKYRPSGTSTNSHDAARATLTSSFAVRGGAGAGAGATGVPAGSVAGAAAASPPHAGEAEKRDRRERGTLPAAKRRREEANGEGAMGGTGKIGFQDVAKFAAREGPLLPPDLRRHADGGDFFYKR